MRCSRRSCWPGGWMWPRRDRTGGRRGRRVRPAAARAGVPHTTARGWARRFTGRGGGLGVAFAALAVGLGGHAIAPAGQAGQYALAGLPAAFGAATGPPGWLGVGPGRVAAPRWRG